MIKFVLRWALVAWIVIPVFLIISAGEWLFDSKHDSGSLRDMKSLFFTWPKS